MDIIECGRLNHKDSIRKLILLSPAPVDVAAKLASTFLLLSNKEKEIEHELLESVKFCENILSDLISIVGAAKNIDLLFQSVDNNNTQFVDVLINCNQKRVISNLLIQQYFIDAWDCGMKMGGFTMFLIFLSILLFPIIWLFFSLPITVRLKKNGVIINKIPIVKFSCFFSSHLYFIILLFLAAVEPIIPISSMIYSVNLTNYIEWILLMWISGIVAAELSNPSDKAGFGIIKIGVLVITTLAFVINIISFFYNADDYTRYDILFVRNLCWALMILFSAIQFLDLLKFHILVGAWAILLLFVLYDLIRIVALTILFQMGFTFLITAINQDAYFSNSTATVSDNSLKNPLVTLKMLFFGIFGHGDPLDMPELKTHPFFSVYIQKISYASYLVTVIIICINTFLAMLKCTITLFYKQLDVEWKFSKAKFIRNMTKVNSNVPSPLHLFTQLFRIILGLIKFKGHYDEYLKFF